MLTELGFKSAFSKTKIEDYWELAGKRYSGNGADVPVEERQAELDAIKMPELKATGYLFFAPYSIRVMPGETKKIPTGIRLGLFEDNRFFSLFPMYDKGVLYNVWVDNDIGALACDNIPEVVKVIKTPDSTKTLRSATKPIVVNIMNTDNKKELLIGRGEPFIRGAILEHFPINIE